MQYRPDAKELILALQDFLMKEILPVVEQKEDLAYKTLVGWNMLGVLAREIEIGFSPTSLKEFRENQRALSQRIREKKISDLNSPEAKEIKEMLVQNLKIANPRFSLESPSKQT